MGQESASYFLPLDPDLEDAVLVALREGGAEGGSSGCTWIDLHVRDVHRYWIDLRLHRAPRSLLEVRIALTNDEWSIRAPLEEAFTALPVAATRIALTDEDGGDLGTLGDDDWSLRLETDFSRRRADFIERVGDFTAPISADHVYMYVHQTRWNRDNDTELAWRRDREIARIEQMWDPPVGEPDPRLPPGHPDAPPRGDG
ncbi:MAG: hypothetical protein QOD69_3087 [Solirubrobacteraceae bacterium]|jgi:hypothetical protein|nr:hypothetical protein [Solirubrobacteraceae bacterium]